MLLSWNVTLNTHVKLHAPQISVKLEIYIYLTLSLTEYLRLSVCFYSILRIYVFMLGLENGGYKYIMKKYVMRRDLTVDS